MSVIGGTVQRRRKKKKKTVQLHLDTFFIFVWCLDTWTILWTNSIYLPNPLFPICFVTFHFCLVALNWKMPTRHGRVLQLCVNSPFFFIFLSTVRVCVAIFKPLSLFLRRNPTVKKKKENSAPRKVGLHLHQECECSSFRLTITPITNQSLGAG